MNFVHRHLLLGCGNRPPRAGLLFYARIPNSGADWTITRTVTDWTGTERDMFAILGEGLFFDAAGNSLVVTDAEILAWPGINQYHILFSLTKGLVVYDLYAATAAVLVKAYRYYHLTYIPFNEWLDATDLLESTPLLEA